jgi:energy-converting hydrogenase Eha subunit H
MMKRSKGSGVSIIAFARKLATIIWTMLSRGECFNESLMTDQGLKEKAVSMREARFREGAAAVKLAAAAITDTVEPAKGVKKPALPRKKHPKVLSSA